MLTLTGKYNSANIMIDNIDQETISQIYRFLNHPAFAQTYIAIMPDCHTGSGVVVGFTTTLNDFIIPNVVGFDIGCGLLATNLGHHKFSSNQDFEDLDQFIKRNIPSGFNIRSTSEKMSNGLYPEETFDKKLLSNVLDLGKETEQEISRVIGSIGTLGGGNHFIEIDHDDNTGNDWLLIHSGSRNFGLRVANYYQSKAKELIKDLYSGASAYQGLEYLPMKEGGEEYLHAMKIAQNYASLNRFLMAKLITNHIFTEWSANTLASIETVHNYINTQDNIVRKGAVAAYEGTQLIIPFNMKDGVMVCRGKGNKLWNFSAPHGAGRILSRREARERITVDDFRAAMQGVYTTTADDRTLDESPMVYKDKDMIVEAVAETVDIEFFMKPVYNFKAGGE
jgi:tRNA-splicing ligase RtcB (3'-phosphate/5'-hydroxy nucleic acid ligase)